MDIFGTTTPVAQKGFHKGHEGSSTNIAIVGAGNLVLVQDWNVTHTQNVTPLYEVGSTNVWFSAAPQAGSLSINLVVHSSTSDEIFTPNACEPKDITIEYKSCNTNCTLSAKGAVCTQATFAGQSAQAHITCGVQYQFAGLEKS